MRYRLRTLLILAAILPPILAVGLWSAATLWRNYRQTTAPRPAKFWPGMWLMDGQGNHIHVSSDGTPASGVPALIRLLSHESPGIRESAAGWLGAIGKDATNALATLQKVQADDPDERVRRAAFEAIQKISSAE